MTRGRVLVGPVALLCVWEVVACLGLVNPLFLPRVETVASTLWLLLLSGGALPDIAATTSRLILGFLIGAGCGTAVGVILGSSHRMYAAMEVPVDFFRSVPVLALFPLFLVVFGLGDTAKIATAAWSTSLIVLVNTMYAVRNTNRTRLMIAQAMRATRVQTFCKVTLPDALPGIFVGMRTGLSLALVVVVVTEMFMGTRTGLGLRIYNAGLLYDTSEMYAAIVLAGVLGYLANKGFVFFERRLIHWVGG